MALSNTKEHHRQCVAPSAATGSNLSLIRYKLAEFTLEYVSKEVFIKTVYKTSAMFACATSFFINLLEASTFSLALELECWK